MSTATSYPYAAGSNPLKNLLPQWVQAGGVAAMLERLAREGDARAHPRRHRARRAQQLGPHPVLGLRADLDLAAPAAVCRPHDRALAAERGQDPIDTVCDYLDRRQGRDARARHLDLGGRHPRPSCARRSPLVGSDGNCVATYGIVSQGMPHPRFYGTFPRIIGHYVGELGLLPLELAIHKMTGATARALKLKDRGLLKEGYRADVTIFDPADFRDRATYADPHQYPTGARTTVIVNGTVVVENAAHTGALPGAVLRRDGDGRVG